MPTGKTKPVVKAKAKAPKAEALQSVKGMRDLRDATYYAYQGFMEKAAEIAMYYGFRPIETPMLEKQDLFSRSVGSDTDIVGKEMYTLKTKGGDQLALRPEGTASVMRAYFEHGMQAEPQPVMLYYQGPFFRHENPQKGRYRQFYQFGLEIIGTTKSVADATIIKLFVCILQEAGLTNLRVQVNSIGDNECRNAYRRELVNYYKKHAREICADCRERLKTNPLRVLDCKNPNCQPIKAAAPETISYLCSGCKHHFKEVLEYLDTMGIDYEINSQLVRGLDYYSRTVFEILSDASAPSDDPDAPVSLPLTIAAGGRYDYLAKTLGHRKDVAAVGGSIGIDRVIEHPDHTRLAPRIIKKPKIFFIQLSFDAKLKSFEVIEILRKARIPIAQSLSKDSLGAQLAIAERIKVPYTIILGQKEALENTVIVRNMDTRSQDTIKIDRLAEYLKKIK
jgi:histidyl-tRNA synthetase